MIGFMYFLVSITCRGAWTEIPLENHVLMNKQWGIIGPFFFDIATVFSLILLWYCLFHFG